MKKHLLLILKTLFNNNACVEAARTREKKYNIIAITFAVFALFFSVLPMTVTGFQQQGQNWVGTSFGVDDGLYRFGEDNKNNTFTMTIAEDPTNSKKNVLNVTQDDWNAKKVAGVDQVDNGLGTKLDNLYRYTYTGKFKSDTVNWLEIYFYDGNGTDAKDGKAVSFQTFYTSIANNLNPYNTNVHMKVSKDKDGKEVNNARSTSFIVFGVREIFCAAYSPASTSVQKTLLGDYNNTPINSDFIKSYFASGDNIKTLTNWKEFFNQSYIDNRFNNTWRTTGIFIGVNGGCIIFFGFVVWLLTRGKNNPFRIYSIWDGQKIAYYCSLTPGLLALFGFLSSQLATMLFLLGLGMRVLWLTMRTLKYTAPAK